MTTKDAQALIQHPLTSAMLDIYQEFVPESRYWTIEHLGLYRFRIELEKGA